jgi:hypothetical protein
MFWHKVAVPLHQKQNDTAMRNTDYNIDALGSLISSDASLQALKDLMDDLGLEVEGVTEF